MSLNNSQYDTLIRQYNARQFHNQHLLDERIQEVYGKCPRLTEIDNEISSISVASAKQLLSDDGAEDSSVLSSLKEQLAALRREKRNLIASLGYPADYLEPVYTCKDCKDTGYIGNERCHCFVQAAIDLVYTQSNVKDILAKELLDKGHSVIYFTAFQLFDIFEKDTFQKDAAASAAGQNIFDCDLLIIDDLGTELANSFTASRLFLCLNERMLRQKSTLISTNLSIDQLADVYSERICSRIFSSYTMIKLFGDDIRLKKKLH